MRHLGLGPFAAVAVLSSGTCLLIGCAKPPSAERPVEQRQVQRPVESSAAKQGASSASQSTARPSYVFSTGTVYYQGDPERGHKPDGTFRRGTRVMIVRRAGNYSVVQAEDGTQAYVATHTLEPLAMQ